MEGATGSGGGNVQGGKSGLICWSGGRVVVEWMIEEACLWMWKLRGGDESRQFGVRKFEIRVSGSTFKRQNVASVDNGIEYSGMVQVALRGFGWWNMETVWKGGRM